MKDYPNYLYDTDWTPEERKKINNSRELQYIISSWPYLGWWTQRKLLLMFEWWIFLFWVRKHERAIQAAMLAVMVLLAVLAILGAMKAK
jgi:hypothetical protein